LISERAKRPGVNGGSIPGTRGGEGKHNVGPIKLKKSKMVRRELPERNTGEKGKLPLKRWEGKIRFQGGGISVMYLEKWDIGGPRRTTAGRKPLTKTRGTWKGTSRSTFLGGGEKGEKTSR